MTITYGVLLAALCATVTACRESRVRAYTVPAERPQPAARTPQAAPRAPVETPRWTAPAGWQELPGNGMRFATLVVEPGDTPLEIRVTPLALMARDPLGNVNRWRGQIGLPEVTEAELGSVVRSIDVNGRQADLVNQTGPGDAGAPPQQILAAILPGDVQVWFFLMMGDAERVSPHAAAFETFIRSVRLESAAPALGAAATDPSMSESGLMPPSGSGASEVMTWNAPSDWVQDTKASDMRIATFRFADSGGEVAITRFPGDVGGLLANINRWRKQLSLSPVSDPQEQPSEPIQVAGSSARLFDISGPGNEETRERMLVVFLPRQDMSWFIKMTGSHALLGDNKKAFQEFLMSIQLKNEAP